MTITTTNIQLYEILRQKLGNQEAEALVGFVDARMKEVNEQNVKTLSTKEDVKDLELKLTQQIDDTKLKIGETKIDIIRWVFALFIPLMLAIIVLYFKK